MVKALAFTVPHLGGTWSWFRVLRDALQEYGIDMCWVAAGRAAQEMVDATWDIEGYPGTIVEPATVEHRRLAEALLEHVLRSGVQVVLVSVFCGEVESNLVRYLPAGIRRIMVVHTITSATYRAAHCLRDWVHATVAVSPRIREDLIRRHGFDRDWTVVIPNAVNLKPFLECAREPSTGPLRVLVHGRIEDTAKGVMWVPSILRRASAFGARLNVTISGDGPDRDRLRRALDKAGFSEAWFAGQVPHYDVPGLLVGHDVLLAPSRFEGLPLALIEAMAAGCVPVASKIRGVTDFVVEDGVNGLLFPVGDVTEAAMHLARLAMDRSLLTRMGSAARISAQSRFSQQEQARAYCELIRGVLDSPRAIRGPLPIDRWHIAPGLRPAWWHGLPEPVKNAARLARERWAVFRALLP